MTENLSIDWSDLKTLAYSHTVKEIARMKGCSYTSARRAMVNRGIPRPQLQITREKLDQIKRLYQSHSTYEIAEMLKMRTSTIKKYIRRLGIGRTQSEAAKLARYKQDNCPHQFTIRIKTGYACLTCKRHFAFH